MGKKGMGWVPDYPDVRDCTLSHEKIKGVQNGQQVNNDNEVDRAQQLLELIKILKSSLANRNNRNLSDEINSLLTLEETFEKEIDSKLHFISATFTNGFLSLGSQGKDVQDLQDKFSH